MDFGFEYVLPESEEDMEVEEEQVQDYR